MHFCPILKHNWGSRCSHEFKGVAVQILYVVEVKLLSRHHKTCADLKSFFSEGVQL